MTTEMEDPGSYGRIVRSADGDIERIVEAKSPGDATPEELAIKEVNAGTYAFAGPTLADALDRLTNDNAQGEYYLGDVLPLLRESGLRDRRLPAPRTQASTSGSTTAPTSPASPTRRAAGSCVAHMRAGVTIEDPGATWIDADVEIAADTTILPGTTLRGRSSIGVGQHDRTDDDADRLAHRRARHGDPFLPDVVRGRRTRRTSARSPTCARTPASARAPRRAPSSRSRTPRSAPAPRSRTSPTSATPTWGRDRTSGRPPSPRTTTAEAKIAPRSARTFRPGLTRPSSRP